MSDCCSPTTLDSEKSGSNVCPSCQSRGKSVKVITLKSLLKPTVLDTLNPDLGHYFCTSEECTVVYFDTDEKVYSVEDIKVPVYQKDKSLTTPICYCFDWTREKVGKYVSDGLKQTPVEHIRQNVKENRCGCEVNNPQGSCCLGNVTGYIKGLSENN